MSEIDIKPPTKPLLRYSLATLLMAMAIVALGITVWQLYRELVPLRAELRRLRDEVGELSIEDDTRFHAIEVRTPEEFVWKWRIWIPEGAGYTLHHTGENIPRQGFPAAHSTITLSDAGEQWIEYRVSRDTRTGKWMDGLSTSGGSVGSSQQDWVEAGSRVSTGDGVGTTTKSFGPGQTIILERYRVSTTANSSSKIEDPSAGFMIWLVPMSAGAGRGTTITSAPRGGSTDAP
jgi:hypothetical protein